MTLRVRELPEFFDGVAQQLAAAGINALALDMRGHGESGGKPFDKMTKEEQGKEWRGRTEDIEVAFEYLASQPGVERDRIGIAGAGRSALTTAS